MISKEIHDFSTDDYQAKSVWSTPPQNESKFNQAFSESRNVILIYSVKVSAQYLDILIEH